MACAQIAFSIRQHVPGEAGDLLRSETSFDGEQQDDLIAIGVAGVLEESSEVGRLAG